MNNKNRVNIVLLILGLLLASCSNNTEPLSTYELKYVVYYNQVTCDTVTTRCLSVAPPCLYSYEGTNIILAMTNKYSSYRIYATTAPIKILSANKFGN